MANPEFDIRRSLLVGDTADVYYQRALTVLRNESLNPIVTMEFFPQRAGVICGIKEARALLGSIPPASFRSMMATSFPSGDIAPSMTRTSKSGWRN